MRELESFDDGWNWMDGVINDAPSLAWIRRASRWPEWLDREVKRHNIRLSTQARNGAIRRLAALK